MSSATHHLHFETVPEMVVDGVHRLSPSGISILIVGAGIGGLSLANEAWRQGHDVRVLERHQSMETVGDTFGIVPPALVNLRHFPSLHKELDATNHDALLSFYTHTGRKLLEPGEAEWNRPGEVHAAKGVRVPWIRARYGLVRALESQVRRLNIPIHYGKKVTSYDEDETKGIVHTESGGVYYADLVVAADGVGTKSHEYITGNSMQPSSSGYAVFRGMIPSERLQDISQEARERYLSRDRPEFRIYLTNNMHMNVIITPEFVNYIFTHEDTGSADESWRSTVSATDVLKIIDEVPDWDPYLKEIIAQTPENSVVDWKLLWRDPQPQWSSESGRVLQLGDSAHSFLPTSGNGATQAMEDALSLATSLRLGGKENIVNSVKAHVLMRFERVATLQRFGFANRQMLHTIDVAALEKNPKLMQMRMGRWIWKHDPVKYARDNFVDALKAAEGKTEFVNTNLPPGHKYVPWTIAGELEREKEGLRSELFSTGNWD